MSTDNILKNLIAFLAPIVAIALLIFLIVQAVKLVKGSSTFKTLICGALVFFFILGLMYACGSYNTYGQLFNSLTNKAITMGTNDLNGIIGGEE